jgi:alpha-L-fucosidase
MPHKFSRFVMTSVALGLAFAALPVAAAPVQRPGGGNLNPGLYTHPAAIKKFERMRIGLSVHWGPSALGGKEISWARNKEIPTATYDNFYKAFNPVKFNADQWMQLMKDGGMKYIVVTSKHHDGFALWHSKYTDYDMANTPSKRDIVRELSQAAKRNGIMFGSYYSIIDWYHPDYSPNEHGGPGPLIKAQADSPNFDRYIAFMQNQLRELIVDYGSEIIQFDGEWDKTWTHEHGSDLYKYVRGLRDETLVSNRTDVGRDHLDLKTGTWNWRVYAGDFDERERMVDWIGKDSKVFGKSDNPWQAWVTIDQAQWAWNATPRLQTADAIILDLVKTVGDGGNYLINLGPRADGSFEPEQADMIRTVGRWLQRYGDGIYGSRAGPFAKEGVYTSTVKGRNVTLFIIDPARTKVTIEADKVKLGMPVAADGTKLPIRRSGASYTIDLAKAGNEKIRVIRLRK